METQTQRFDVLCLNRKTRKVEEVFASNVREFGTYNSAASISDMMRDRVNDKYRVAVEDAGRYRKGDTVA
jgi:hypothetical protein